MNYCQDEQFDKIDFSKKPLNFEEYDGCTFQACDFSNVYLGSVDFINCQFINCNMSMAKIGSTSFKEVSFTKCKLLGVNFTDSNPFLLSLRFNDCVLDLSNFYDLPAKKTIFDNCSLKEVDFTQTNLSAAIFRNCDLHMAQFDRTILEKADLRGSVNYQIDPSDNRVKGARFSVDQVLGLLYKYKIKVE